MNENDFDLAARAWLDDGPSRMSDRAVLSTLEEIHTTRQRRAFRPAWRTTPVSSFARLGIAAVLVIAVGLLARYAIQREPNGTSVGGSPTPSSSAEPATSPSALPSSAPARGFPELATTFASPRNGFSIKVPTRAAVEPATNMMGFGEEGFDVVETGLSAVFKGTSTWMPPIENRDEWIDQVVEDAVACGVPRSQQAEITVDGQPGRISECANQIDATIVTDERLYLFSLLHDRGDARAVFDAFAATIDLTPETAVDYAKPDSTFVSPTYGFSFEHYDRGGLTPATEGWDPLNQPLGEMYSSTHASIETPSGISVDAALK
jgi:hypothetical protein